MKPKSRPELPEATDATLDRFERAPAALLMFYADTCSACRVLLPLLEDLAHAYRGKVAFAKVNVDGNSKSGEKYDIIGTPTLVVLRNGAVRWRLYGAQAEPKLREALEEVSS